jgi:hypothetical protein
MISGPRTATSVAVDQQNFEARIAMKMEGKSMIMTETQSGRRIGDYLASDMPHP